MTTLKEQLQADLTSAMRERDQVRAGSLRMALTAVTNEEVAGKEHRELTDDDVLKVLTKEAKKRREAAEAYLPKQLGEDELEAIVREAVKASGASGMPQMGLAMKAASAAVAGRAEGGRVAAIVRRVLAG